jgi:signal transduction histidine kinase
MRWWLALAFALIAAVTAVAVAEVFSSRSERAFRERAEDIAVGRGVGAVESVVRLARTGDLDELNLDEAVGKIAAERRIGVFVLNAAGTRLSAEYSHGVRLEDLPEHEEPLAEALEGRRSVTTSGEAGFTLVAQPIRVAGPLAEAEPGPVAPGDVPSVVMVYVSLPELVAELGIVRDKIVEAALWAVLVGAGVGLLVATLITARLRRIGSAAAEIEAGNFERPLEPRFRDELGALAITIDRMRQRLRDSFAILESERDRLHRLLERLHEGVITVDRSLRVEFANAAACRMLGTPGLARGDELPEPWESPSLRRLAAALFVVGHAPPSQARASPSEERAYLVVGLPARHGAEGAVLVITDVSEQERRERAEREFVTNAAHELRTPLTAITSAVDVLQAGAKEDPPERDRFLAHIERESARLGRLTRALLVLARAQTKEEAPRLVSIELGPLLEEIAAGVHPAQGVEVRVDCPPGLRALAEPDLIEQALASLAGNAAKNTTAGRIVLEARRLGAGTICIDVRDTGRGISLEEQERIFDRFYRAGRRDAEGFGLGLAIVRQVVRTLGGRVDVESRPGEGTTVRVTLPAGEQQAA